jgi:hypothetical protein
MVMQKGERFSETMDAPLAQGHAQMRKIRAGSLAKQQAITGNGPERCTQ